MIPFGSFRLLEAGEVDIIMAPEQDVPGGFYKQKGLDVFQVCIVRQGHPEVGKRLTIKEFLSIPHVMVNIPGTDVSGIDQALAAKGLSRRIAVRVPSFLAVPWIIAKSDLIAVLPDMLVDQVGPLLPVDAHPMPLPAPQLAVFMYWHERTNNSPAHQWMRSQISELAAEMEHSLTFRKAG
ncbi:MAG: LysR substrate-binding domain-containing protein [Bdellovibrionota bacterium]